MFQFTLQTWKLTFIISLSVSLIVKSAHSPKDINKQISVVENLMLFVKVFYTLNRIFHMFLYVLGFAVAWKTFWIAHLAILSAKSSKYMPCGPELQWLVKSLLDKEEQAWSQQSWATYTVQGPDSWICSVPFSPVCSLFWDGPANCHSKQCPNRVCLIIRLMVNFAGGGSCLLLARDPLKGRNIYLQSNG